MTVGPKVVFLDIRIVAVVVGHLQFVLCVAPGDSSLDSFLSFLCMGKYYFMAGLCAMDSIATLATDFLAWLNPIQSYRRSAVQP